jgi:protein-L-isoaspartate(D-aspartate) O-methyltransferase
MKYLPVTCWLAVFFLLAVGCSAPLTQAPGATVPAGEEQAEPEAGPDATAESPEETAYKTQRLEMVGRTIRGRGVKDPLVLQAMETVPRHRFVLPEYLGQAYDDHPLPIGFGQTISQPYIVALMTELMQLQPDSKVLEVGTGSGYQAAVLAELMEDVYSIEIIPELAQRATETLNSLGYDNVRTRRDDGYYGWPEEAPFDAIIVTAAPDHVPQPLVQQLADGGRLIVPIGPQGGFQSLWQITRQGEALDAVNIAPVRFVPLVGGGQSDAERGVPEDRFLDPPGGLGP